MERLTSRQLRARAAESGYKLSGARFNDLRRWGLIPAPDAVGCWSEDIADRLVRIGALGRSVRSMPRRVIILRCEGVPIPPDKVRDAMCDVIPTITQSVSKMKRAMKARELLAAPDVAQLTVRERRKREREAWRPPPPAKWLNLMRQGVPEWMERRFGIWCIAAKWSTERVRNTAHDIANIPIEELVTLFAIQDIAIQLENVQRDQEVEKSAKTI
jgi:hypothetical protein